MTPAQIAVVVGASLLGAAVKSVTGLGYPVIAVPLIAIVLGIEDAVVIVALPNLGANLYLWWETRDTRGAAPDLPRLVVTGVLGALVGTVALVRLPSEPLLLALAVVIVAFVVQFLRRPDVRLDPVTAARWSPLVGGVVGLSQGALGVSGPIVAMWMHGYRLAPRDYVHAVTTIFAVTGAAQIVMLTAQAEFSASRLVAAAAAAVPVAVVTPLGARLRHRLAGRAFELVVLGVLCISAISLGVDALT